MYRSTFWEVYNAHTWPTAPLICPHIMVYKSSRSHYCFRNHAVLKKKAKVPHQMNVIIFPFRINYTFAFRSTDSSPLNFKCHTMKESLGKRLKSQWTAHSQSYASAKRDIRLNRISSKKQCVATYHLKLYDLSITLHCSDFLWEKNKCWAENVDKRSQIITEWEAIFYVQPDANKIFCSMVKMKVPFMHVFCSQSLFLWWWWSYLWRYHPGRKSGRRGKV